MDMLLFLDLSSIFMSANLAIVELLLLVNEAISFAYNAFLVMKEY